MKPSRRGFAGHWKTLVFGWTLSLASCAGQVPVHVVSSFTAAPDWKPALPAQDIITVEQEFPLFVPELFAPGTDPSSIDVLNPNDFAPAQFFGPANPQGFKPSPHGILIETNGYDQTVPDALTPSGTYFGPGGNGFSYSLGVIAEKPLNILRKSMNLPPDPNASVVMIDLARTRVDPAYVDTLMFELRDQLAIGAPPNRECRPAQLPYRC